MTIYIAFTHFLADFLNSFFKPLGPYFIEKYGIDSRTFTSSIALIGAFSSIVQIFFGLYFDRKKRDGLYVVLLVFLEIIIISLTGLVNGFYLLIMMIFLMRLTNSAFHPIGASFAGRHNKGNHVALFSIFGALGAAVGPIVITLFIKNYKFSNVYIIAIISFFILLIPATKLWKYEKKETSERTIPKLENTKVLFPVFLLVTTRGFIMNIFHTFVPIFVNLKGSSIVMGGVILSIGLIAGMFTNYFGAYLREKTGIKIINLIGFLGMGVSGLLFYFSGNDFLRILSFMLFDIFGFLTMSANLVEAQVLMPKNKSFASSIAMGFSWSIGGFMASGYSAIFGNNVPFVIFSVSIISIVVAFLFPILKYKK